MKVLLLKFVCFCRLAVLGKLNNFVKEWIAEISELKVGFVGVNALQVKALIYDMSMSQQW